MERKGAGDKYRDGVASGAFVVDRSDGGQDRQNRGEPDRGSKDRPSAPPLRLHGAPRSLGVRKRAWCDPELSFIEDGGPDSTSDYGPSRPKMAVHPFACVCIILSNFCQ